MKKSVFTLIVILITTFCYGQLKIKGVVTYIYDEALSNKPDIGTNVIVVDTASVKDFDYKLWQNYHYGKEFRKIHEIDKKLFDNYNDLYEKSKSLGVNEDIEKYKKELEKATIDMNETIKQLGKYDSETDDKFNIIDKKLSTSLFQFIIGKDKFIKTTVDGNGTYSVNVKPGVYYVFMKSKNTTDITITDISGVVYIRKVIIKDNDKDVSANFEIN